MCGIVCYVGKQKAKPILLEGLKRLEYRGYDSAGLAVQNGPHIDCFKAVGKIIELEKKINDLEIEGASGIAHTRWATHGEPSEINAHPQTDQEENVFVIHNGIIENFYILKRKLEKSGATFSSETDTEVLAHLIARNFDGSLQEAVRKTMTQVEGTFGLAVIHREAPGEVVVARRGSPLIIGVGKDGNFAASDVAAMVRYTNEVIHLNDNELALITEDQVSISTAQAKAVTRAIEKVEWQPEDAELNGFPHFMLKEIYEQPETARNAMRGRLELSEGVSKLGGIMPVWDQLKECRHMVFVACGTSYHAGCVGRYIFERLTEIDVEVEIASEFRYRKLNFPPNTFIVAISQSGETADTLAAIREARRKGARLLGIVNVVGSSISRETEAGIYNHAGPEIGVASTKIFVSQLVILTLLAVLLGRHQKLSLTEGVEAIKALSNLPDLLRRVLSQDNHIQAIAEKYYCCNNWLFLGRKYEYPIALEAALKLKEISYIHAEGYPAGEMKHGPIALINPDMPTVAIVPQDSMYEKMMSNIQEVKSRRGPIIAIATEGDRKIRELADEVIEVPPTLEYLYPALTVVPCQLLAYYCARFLNRDIDKPRNLAKSVTVE
ncbi:MAG: glutamine--fructose-6-phosphate transaminase (isomerizing) [Deltaproteobacteria bacterium]|nr:glutamine--fructose-6-phosphate transaminase (isomerizing) [Deltaproteobacteria bacterium]MBW1936792.1 glutamine--fructose-6-phosphate transaminase (isomerizing) [Deltaproteobacteria bacterium]MBW1978586.1 glutamine--fructose-6-phosphate transaminase (isomerizing) [Deltaproteobacteria bacterium]MBW2045762.1 glutamine--fructose-6-phosphate transaminase (isomerizing) [Deltaproteobacteria bacterium]MBW2301611.1 glutamine--fructose-6-phosphate transaminase (isomerizing) [Deltaproteobacteria bact